MAAAAIQGVFPELDMHQETVTNLYIAKTEERFLEATNMNVINTKNSDLLRFELTVPSSTLLDIRSIKFETSFKVKKRDEHGNLSDLHATGANALIDPNIFHNQFKNIRIHLDEKDLGKAVDDEMLHHLAYMENVFSINETSNNMWKHVSTDGFWNPGNLAQLETLDTYTPTDNNSRSKPYFNIRKQLVNHKNINLQDSTWNVFCDRLKHWFFSINSCLPQHIKLTVLLEKQSNPNIYATYNNVYDNARANTAIPHGIGLEYQHIKMYYTLKFPTIPHVPALGNISPWEQIVGPLYAEDPAQRKMIKYSFTRHKGYELTVPRGITQWQHTINVERFPKELWFGLQDEDRTRGAREKSAFVYKHFNLERIIVEKDGKVKFPSGYDDENGVELDFGAAQKNIIRIYEQMFETYRVGKDNDFYREVTTPCTSFKEWNQPNDTAFKNLFRIDITDTNESAAKKGLVPIHENGNLKITLRFRQNTPGELYLVLFMLYDDFIQFDPLNVNGMTQTW